MKEKIIQKYLEIKKLDDLIEKIDYKEHFNIILKEKEKELYNLIIQSELSEDRNF
jgi:hypothetical protein